MDAKVICRMLGFDPTNSVATKESAFGEVSSDFIMDDVHCEGTEFNILLCNHSKTHNCNPREGAGVICGTNVELVGGSHTKEGNVLLNRSPIW